MYCLGEDGRYDRGELREPARDYRPVASKALDGFVVEPERLFAETD